jgi:serpin B
MGRLCALFTLLAAAASATIGNNNFAVDLYSQINGDESKNLAFSPASISFALAMTYGGARGQTAAEMQKALHFEADIAGLGALMAQLNAEGKKPGVQLTVVNRTWAQKGFPWSKSFVEKATKAWAAGVESADFVNQADKVRRTINAWVEKQTRSRIKDLLPDDSVDRSTVMVLVNAIYFKGQWLHKFDKKDTRTESFTTASGQKVQAPLMHQTHRLPYATGPGLQLIELPYKNTTLAMDLVVPDDDAGLPAVEKQLAHLPEWLAALQPAEDVELTLPRFEVTAPLDLKPPLLALGMSDAFSDGADFTGMLSDPRGHHLFISAVLHKAFVRVDESGSEAAAATAVMMSDDAVHIPPKVRADHPFIWIIRDTSSGAILFVGRVSDPTRS